MSGPVLIGTGKSERGWSFYGDFEICMHYGALTRLAGLDDNAPPLVKGSLGHTALAHYYARWGCKQAGLDPDAYYDPETAMEAYCALHPEGWEWLDLLRGVFRRYVAKNPEPTGRVVGVEFPIKGVFGTREGVWGLWVVHPDDAPLFTLAWRQGSPLPRAIVGGFIEPTPLNVPGHRDCGAPVFLTRHLDLLMEHRGRVDIIDHKFKLGVTRATAAQYAMDGQFAAARLFGVQLYGERMGRALVNFVQVKEPWTVRLDPLPATPWRDGMFARTRFRRAHEVAQLEVEEPDPHRWPMAEHEQVCVRRYGGDGGLCTFTDACRLGPSALVGRT